MINKKAILVENVLSLLIAAVGIALLIFGAVKLYKITVSQEEENAKTLINVLEGKINTLQDGETGKFPIQGIEKWFLTGWSKNAGDRPNKCFFESCICICPLNFNPTPIYGRDTSHSTERIESCQEEGFCREIDKETIWIFNKFNQPFIVLPKNLIELEIRKTKDLEDRNALAIKETS